MSIRVVKRKELRMENQFERQIGGLVFFKEQGLPKKRKIPPKNRIGATAAHPDQ